MEYNTSVLWWHGRAVRGAPSVMLREAIRVAPSIRGIALLGIAVYCLAQNREVSEREVLPIVQRCFQCHGPTLRMSDLDLHTREGMLKGGTRGPALVPGNAEG